MNRINKESLTKSDIKLSLKKEFPNLTTSDISEAINIILESILEAVALDEKVEIRGFGVFSTNTQKARISRNPKTGEKINTPKKKSIHFKYAKDMFKKLNNEEE